MNRRLDKTLCLLTLIGAGPMWVSAQPAPPDAEPSLQELARQFHEEAGTINWEVEYRSIERNVDRVWGENGWNNESDQFAKKLVREISAIPPWQVFDRLNALSGKVAERYGLTGVQGARFKASLVREAGGLLVRNSPLILRQTRDFIQLNREDRPFTSDQIARWVQESMPMLAEAYESSERLISEIRPGLTPEKRAVLERDVESYGKRRKYLDETVARWVEGGWTPRDWGLEDDPRYSATPNAGGPSASLVQEPVLPTTSPKPVQPPAALIRMTKWVAYDPATWFAYVLEAKEIFKLDPGQFTAARSIHDELFQRASAYAVTHAESLSRVPPDQKAVHDAFGPIRTLFEELRMRVDAIPTSAQRSAGKP